MLAKDKGRLRKQLLFSGAQWDLLDRGEEVREQRSKEEPGGALKSPAQFTPAPGRGPGPSRAWPEAGGPALSVLLGEPVSEASAQEPENSFG